MYPAYAIVERRVFSEYPTTQTEVQRFMVFLQGYKMNIGFKVRRRLCYKNGLRDINYQFIRYGWSTGMLKWRSDKLKQKLYYLENFFQGENINKVDSFLFNDRNVLVEKTFKCPETPLPLISFNR